MKTDLDTARISDFCRRNRISRIEAFGSALRDDFRPDSDIDLLVEFEPDAPMDLFEFNGLQIELTELLGRKVDLVPRRALKPLIRDEILATARVIYAAA